LVEWFITKEFSTTSISKIKKKKSFGTKGAAWKSLDRPSPPIDDGSGNQRICRVVGGDSAAKQETPMQMMRSLGDGHLMENTQQKVHIVFSSLAAPERHCSTQFGRPKPNQNAVFLLGSYSKKRS